MVRPSQRREMARRAVQAGITSIVHACRTFEVSQTWYRYRAKACQENAIIADWLLRLTSAYRDWGFGLCFLHLRNVKGFAWNHKRVYRIYRDLELNLRIKPRKRIVREAPEPLAVPEAVNETWSMDFMHDQLADGRSFRMLNVPDDFNRQGLVMEVDISLPAARVIRSWNRSFNGAESSAPYAATTSPSASAERCKHGPSGKTLRCSTSSQAILSRTPTSSATTGPCVTLGLLAICSMTSNRSRTSPLVGYGLTITSAQTWRSAASRQCRSLHWQRSSIFGDR